MTRIKLLTSQLLYDIRNIAYVEGHVLEDDTTEREHTRHLVTDIAEDGNIDIVARSLHLSFTGLQWALARAALAPAPRYTDTLALPPAYELRLTACLSHAHASLLTQLAHRFMVASALYHWLSITHPDTAAKWRTEASECESRMASLTLSLSPATRRPSPF